MWDGAGLLRSPVSHAPPHRLSHASELPFYAFPSVIYRPYVHQGSASVQIVNSTPLEKCSQLFVESGCEISNTRKSPFRIGTIWINREFVVGFRIMEEQPQQDQRTTFGSRLAGFGKAAFRGTRRMAHLAALKAKIEKLKLVDLHKAQYALGRKAYELRIADEKLGGEYEEIAAIEKSIGVKRAGLPGDHSATNMQLVKSAAVSVKMRAEAEGLELKLKQMFVALGSGVELFSEAAGLESEITGVRSVNSQVEVLEQEYSTLSENHAA